MSNLTLTIVGATLAELQASAAAFAGYNGTVGGALSTQAVNYSPTTTIAPTAGPSGDDDDGAPADANAPAFDKTGLPWDARIHSSSKKCGKDGSWNRRRNTTDAEWTNVTNELRARMAGGNGQAGAPPAQFTPPPMTMPPQGAPGTPQFAPPAMMQPAPFTPPPIVQQQPEQPAGMSFQAFMPLLSNAMHAGRYTAEELAQWQRDWQIAEIGHLMNDPVKTLNFYNWLKSGNRID